MRGHLDCDWHDGTPAQSLPPLGMTRAKPVLMGAELGSFSAARRSFSRREAGLRLRPSRQRQGNLDPVGASSSQGRRGKLSLLMHW